MDYDKIKLGLIGKIRVWNLRREAEKTRDWRDRIEGEVSEVDYSEADELEKSLLDKKKLKIATKKATKEYKKDNTGISKENFIENYLIENGLKQKALPASKKAREEFAKQYEKMPRTMYYEVDGEKYQIPRFFSENYFEQLEKGENDFTMNLTTNDSRNYIVEPQEMSIEDKYKMFKKLIDNSLSQIGEETYMIASVDKNSKLKEDFPRLTRQASRNDYVAEKLRGEGKVEEANSKLEEMVVSALKFYDAMSKGDYDVKSKGNKKDELGR